MNSHEARARSNKSRYDLCSTNIDLLMTRQIPSESIPNEDVLLGEGRAFFNYRIYVYELFTCEGSAKAEQTKR
jgi:hypothetical protein